MATILLLFLLFFFLHQPLSSSLSDTDALLLLKSSFGNTDPALSSWSTSSVTVARDESSTTPCTASWTGVHCERGFFIRLRLDGLGLEGTINVEALSHFGSLRSISFNNNNLSGPLPNIGRLDALKSIYLSNNRFSGLINDSLFSSMDHLKKLWLNGNELSGRIPSSLSNASLLVELHLEGNGFTGAIPALQLPALRSFNVSNNDLQGPIPISLAHFSASAFAGNPKLCGPPLNGPRCPIPTSHMKEFKQPPPGLSKDSNSGQLVLLVFGILLVFLALVIGYAAVKTRGRDQYADSFRSHHDAVSVTEAMEAAASASPVQLPAAASSRSRSKERSGSNRGNSSVSELVMVNDEKGVFALPDLMKAAAEVLGNGGLGSVYQAVMANGLAVAVKRMRELNRLNKEGFDREMRRLGRLRHPNLLPLLAYHFRKEENLVVSEYVEKGSLLYVLHGDRGADHAALDWQTRLKIILGIARSMAYLHAELAYDLPHGNLKTGNILLGPDFEPILADYGLIALVNPSAAPNVLFAFKSPEAPHVSPKSDVYCFGVVLLEILTGKFPSQYLNNTKGGVDVVHWAASAVPEGREADLIDPQLLVRATAEPEMVRMLRLGVSCTEVRPNDRPEMMEAAGMVEDIAAGGSGGNESVSLVGPTQPWRNGSLRESSRRSERAGEAPPEQWSGDLLSFY